MMYGDESVHQSVLVLAQNGNLEKPFEFNVNCRVLITNTGTTCLMSIRYSSPLSIHPIQTHGSYSSQHTPSQISAGPVEGSN
jgi:hypothetical protein